MVKYRGRNDAGSLELNKIVIEVVNITCEGGDTQKDIAIRAGLAASTISNIMVGYNGCSLPVASKILAACGYEIIFDYKSLSER